MESTLVSYSFDMHQWRIPQFYSAEFCLPPIISSQLPLNKKKVTTCIYFNVKWRKMPMQPENANGLNSFIV